eukprot:jgi/Ulvmu1/1868/UM012_0024.1
MKFGKLIGRAEELLPDLKHLCIRYKELKKYLRNLRPDDEDGDSSPTSKRGSDPQAERKFLQMLHEDVRRLNDYFCEKEEEVVIMLQQLDEQTSAATTDREKQLCHVGYIHLHGQLVLLFHWSMLNYTALIKILKKHDKVSGVELKEPVLSNALKQPFSTTGMLSSLMAKCEQKAKELESTTGGLDTLLRTFPQYECLFLIKETEAALDVWSDLRSNVSTPSTFLDPKLLTALTATRDGSNASTNTKRKRSTECAAAPPPAAAATAPVAACDTGPAAADPLKPRRAFVGAAPGNSPDSRPQARASSPASMEEVRAAAAGAIRAMSRHVSQVDFETHGGGALVGEGANAEQLEIPMDTIAADDESATVANCP